MQFIGFEVQYQGEVDQFQPGPAIIRCLLCWTGDHPAQCEVVKFLSSEGIHPCQRDEVEGTFFGNAEISMFYLGAFSSISTQYYYGEYQYHQRFRWPSRSICNSIDDIKSVDERKKASDTGFIDVSIIHRLYHLYHFDVLHHFVYDVMHTVLLRVVKIIKLRSNFSLCNGLHVIFHKSCITYFCSY